MTHRHINPLYIFFALGVAAFNSSQSRVNGALGEYLKHPTVAALISFGGGIAVLSVLLLSSSQARAGFVAIPGYLRSGELKWFQCIGGVAGAFYVIGQGFVVPIVGVSVFVIAVVAGQTVSSLLVDNLGWGPAGPKAISATRIFAAGLAIVGVIISVLGRDHSGSFSLPAVIYAFVSGALQSAQYAVNGRVAVATGNPISTSMVNFIMGFTTLTFIFIVQTFALGKAVPSLPNPMEHPLLWIGGPIGVVFIASAAVMVHRLGVLIFSLTTVVGQLIGALLLDILLPTSGSHISFELVLGVVITGLAVVLASRNPKRIPAIID